MNFVPVTDYVRSLNRWRAERQREREREIGHVEPELSYTPLIQMPGRDLERSGAEADPPSPLRDDCISQAANRLIVLHDWREATPNA